MKARGGRSERLTRHGGENRQDNVRGCGGDVPLVSARLDSFEPVNRDGRPCGCRDSQDDVWRSGGDDPLVMDKSIVVDAGCILVVRLQPTCRFSNMDLGQMGGVLRHLQ